MRHLPSVVVSSGRSDKKSSELSVETIHKNTRSMKCNLEVHSLGSMGWIGEFASNNNIHANMRFIACLKHAVAAMLLKR